MRRGNFHRDLREGAPRAAHRSPMPPRSAPRTFAPARRQLLGPTTADFRLTGGHGRVIQPILA